MTALIETNRIPAARSSVRTVDIAGVAWPIHKVHALIAAVVVGVASLAILQSPEVTVWLTGVVLLAVWWVERYRPGNAASAPRSNPPGIS